MAPKPKHERLIQGSWDSLGAEQKKNAVKLIAITILFILWSFLLKALR